MSMTQALHPLTPHAEPIPARITGRAPRERLRPRTLLHLLAVPAAMAVALLVHRLIPDGENTASQPLYGKFLTWMLWAAVAGSGFAIVWPAWRRWAVPRAPILAAAILFVCFWELITAKLALLPLPYFPGPDRVLQNLIDDRKELRDNTWASLILLLSGYAVGCAAGLISGVAIGWSIRARYWGMPILKIVGPIPATAWIPLAMLLFPAYSGIFLVALAVWFPVTMLSASGIANVRTSYLDVARTLGARRGYLIFRVAIPAALPSIFIGLFMGLGTSFLTLVVAESVGVKAGLGWYVTWAQGWAEYGKVYAAMLIMAAFFSTIMTALFKLRDRVLVWQKGVIRW